MKQTIDIKALQHLKELLIEGNDAKILTYVKKDIAINIDSYINLAGEVPQLQIDLLQSQVDYTEMEIKFANLRERVNKSLKGSEIH